ncbi:MAG: hypothetical protein KTR26_14150 [Flammeovirgaceae bacterium]|nr:hypothetical protein [Flammeovirgaceae bacterium]
MKFELVFSWIWIVAFLIFAAAKCSPNPPIEELQGFVWYHIQEKDEDNLKYFQKENENMALGRREAFLFKTEGEFEWLKPGPNDKRVSQKGRWKKLKRNEIEVEFGDNTFKKLQIKIVSFEGDAIKLQY